MKTFPSIPNSKKPLGAKISFWRSGKILVISVGFLAVLFSAFKVWQIYRFVELVRADIKPLEQIQPNSLTADMLDRFDPLLEKTHQDINSLREEVAPWLWLTDRMGWLPQYGGDLQYAGDILEMAASLVDSARETVSVARPILDTVQQGGQSIRPSELTQMLLHAQPSLLLAQAALHQSMQARQRISITRLSARNQELLARVDSFMLVIDQGLSIGLTLPDFLGGTSSGPKTYLILLQNEDELRPTGGFITSVAKAVVSAGNLANLSIVDSYSIDDSTKPYPVAPWQLQSFMNIPVLTFRDSNWFVDYPTTAQWARLLYSYTNTDNVDGVVAMDQHVLQDLLAVTGPVFVSDLNITITAQNIKDMMRSQKVPPPPQYRDPDWYRKEFMRSMASAILARVLNGAGIPWKQMGIAMLNDLNQRHILVQLNNPVLSSWIAERGWDGSVMRTNGDFLMAVDTNVGYNKTNAVVDRQIDYAINLTDPSNPSSRLVLTYSNNAVSSPGPCDEKPADNSDPTSVAYWYAIDRCYYNYLRVYLPIGTRLAEAAPQAVTRAEMVMLDQDIPARVDVLNEPLAGLQGFGTLMVVPMSQTGQISFQFRLPPDIVLQDPGSGTFVYQIRIQKQPGLVSVPVVLRVQLPNDARVISVLPFAVLQNSTLFLQSDLMQDFQARIEFQVKR